MYESRSKHKLIPRLLLVLLIVALLAVLLFAVAFLLLREPSRKDAVALNAMTAVESKKETNQPVRISIPSIKVDAPIVPLGVTRGGDMEAPASPELVGWYKHGPRPGEIGSAVVDGHYGIWENGERSVFDNLRKLKAGELIVVEVGNGESHTFVVRESRDFDPQASTTSIFKSSDGRAHLNLITCDGAWDAATKSYSKRLVVFADKQ